MMIFPNKMNNSCLTNSPIANNKANLYSLQYSDKLALTIIERDVILVWTIDGKVDIGCGLEEEGSIRICCVITFCDKFYL